MVRKVPGTGYGVLLSLGGRKKVLNAATGGVGQGAPRGEAPRDKIQKCPLEHAPEPSDSSPGALFSSKPTSY